jgi:hypothetical protein
VSAYSVEKLGDPKVSLGWGLRKECLDTMIVPNCDFVFGFFDRYSRSWVYAPPNAGLCGNGHNRLAIRRRFCAVAASRNSSGTARPAQSQSIKFHNPFEVRKQHLHLLSIFARLLIKAGVGDSTSNIACRFIDPNPASDRQSITASQPARHHPESWSGISRNGGPS